MQYAWFDLYDPRDKYGWVPVGVIMNVDTYEPYVLMDDPERAESWRRIYAYRAEDARGEGIPPEGLPYFYNLGIGHNSLRFGLYDDAPEGIEKAAERILRDGLKEYADARREEAKQTAKRDRKKAKGPKLLKDSGKREL